MDDRGTDVGPINPRGPPTAGAAASSGAGQMSIKIHVVNLKLFLRTASHHVTWLLGTRFPKTIPLVFVVGYPKSGTTWVSQLVADYLQLPWPRMSLLPVGCPAVVHGHERVWKSYPKGVFVLRDGRDALVSQYFHLSRPIAPGDHPSLTARQRRTFPAMVNKANVRDNIAGFIERQMTKPNSSRVNWGEHVRSHFEGTNSNVVMLRYEDLLGNGEPALAGAMSQLTSQEADLDRVRDTIKKFSFRQQAGQHAGQEDRSSFLRKGQSGDWANHFTLEAAEIFDHHCGRMLIRTGYERDHSWVRSCGREASAADGVGQLTPAEQR